MSSRRHPTHTGSGTGTELQRRRSSERGRSSARGGGPTQDGREEIRRQLQAILERDGGQECFNELYRQNLRQIDEPRRRNGELRASSSRSRASSSKSRESESDTDTDDDHVGIERLIDKMMRLYHEIHLIKTKDDEYQLYTKYVREYLSKRLRQRKISNSKFIEECHIAAVFVRVCFFSDDHRHTCGLMQRIAFPFDKGDRKLNKEWREMFPNRHPIIANWLLSMRVCRNAIYDGPPISREFEPRECVDVMDVEGDLGGCKSNNILTKLRMPLELRRLKSVRCPTASSRTSGGSDIGFHVPGVVCLSKACQEGKTPELHHKILLDMLLGTSRVAMLATQGSAREYDRFRQLFERDFKYISQKMEEKIQHLPKTLRKESYLNPCEYIVDPKKGFFRAGKGRALEKADTQRNRPKNGKEYDRMVKHIRRHRPTVYVMLGTSGNMKNAIRRVINAIRDARRLRFDPATGRWNVSLVIDEAHHCFREFNKKNVAGPGDWLKLHKTMFFDSHTILRRLIEDEENQQKDMTRLAERVEDVGEQIKGEHFEVKKASPMNMFHTTLITATVMSVGLTRLLRASDICMIRCNTNEKHARPGAANPAYNIPLRTYDKSKLVQTITKIFTSDREKGIHSNIPIITTGTYDALKEKCEDLRKHFEKVDEPVIIVEGFFRSRGEPARIMCNKAGRRYLKWICVAENKLFIDSNDRKKHGISSKCQDKDGRWCFKNGGKMFQTESMYRRLGATADRPIRDVPCIVDLPFHSRRSYRLPRRYDMIQKMVELEHSNDDDQGDGATKSSADAPLPSMQERVRILYLSNRQLREAVSAHTSDHKWKPTALILLPLGVRNPIKAMEKRFEKDAQAFIQELGRANQILDKDSFPGSGIYFPSEYSKRLSEVLTKMNEQFVVWMEHVCGKKDDTRVMMEAARQHNFHGYGGIRCLSLHNLLAPYRNAPSEKMDALEENCTVDAQLLLRDEPDKPGVAPTINIADLRNIRDEAEKRLYGTPARFAYIRVMRRVLDCPRGTIFTRESFKRYITEDGMKESSWNHFRHASTNTGAQSNCHFEPFLVEVKKKGGYVLNETYYDVWDAMPEDTKTELHKQANAERRRLGLERRRRRGASKRRGQTSSAETTSARTRPGADGTTSARHSLLRPPDDSSAVNDVSRSFRRRRRVRPVDDNNSDIDIGLQDAPPPMSTASGRTTFAYIPNPKGHTKRSVSGASHLPSKKKSRLMVSTGSCDETDDSFSTRTDDSFSTPQQSPSRRSSSRRRVNTSYVRYFSDDDDASNGTLPRSNGKEDDEWRPSSLSTDEDEDFY